MNNINLPSSDPSVGNTANPLLAISQAVNTFQDTRQAQFQAAQDRQALLAQREQAKNQLEKENASAALNTIKPFLLKNPHYTDDPAVMGVVQKHFDTLGIPIPKLPDGKIDIDSFKDPVAPLELDKVLSLPVGTARSARLDAMRQQFTGITPEMYTADAAVSPKDAAAIAKMEQYGKHLGNVDTLAAQRTTNQTLLANARQGLITQETNNLITKNAQIQAQTQLDLVKAADIPQRTAIARQNADTTLQRVQHMATGRSLTNQSWNQASKQLNGIKSEYHRDVDTITKLRQQQAALTAGGVSTDDPAYQAMDTQIGTLEASVAQLEPVVGKINDALTQNYSSLIAETTLSRATGKQVSIPDSNSKPLGAAPPGVQDGQTGTYNGVKVVVRNGQFYKQ